jgi:hypothetical protein
MPLDIAKVVAEVEKGLETEAKQRMGEAQDALDFYNYRGQMHMTESLAENEGAIGSVKRRFRPSGLVREIANVLTQHLYNPGPSRTWSEPAGDEFLQKVYSDNHVNALMKRCDKLGTVADAAAIQVDADMSRFEDRPIVLRVWGPDEFHTWEDPDDRTQVGAVVTRDKYDEQTRYRLWTADEFRTFMTQKGSGTSGGRVATQVDARENPYGCIPFGFTHYEYPVQAFWEPGIGDFLKPAEECVNDRLSRLNQAIHAHLNPLAIMYNAVPGIRIVVEPQRFIALPGPRPEMGKQGMASTEGPRPEYLQAHIDVASAWEDLRGYLVQVLEACGVPQSAVRMEQSGVASGISLLVEQAPLLTRARERRIDWGIYETEFARTILRCAGSYYGRADLVGAAKAGTLSLGWPAPSIPVPTDDWIQTERQKVELGIKSLIMVTAEMYGVAREQAVEILKQVKDDQDELERINPDLKPEPPLPTGKDPEQSLPPEPPDPGAKKGDEP